MFDQCIANISIIVSKIITFVEAKSFQILKMNVTNMLDDEKFQQMQDIVDVYEYRDKLLMPKMVISTAGDEFFILDNSRFAMNFA